MPGMVHGQPSRFATMLFYLNDDMEGGETSFPRWLNAETSEALKVKPERGKAVLFYNLLPDGNYDERSQHAAMPVTKGEKVRALLVYWCMSFYADGYSLSSSCFLQFLTNLWVWDPIMDQQVNFLSFPCFSCFARSVSHYVYNFFSHYFDTNSTATETI